MFIQLTDAGVTMLTTTGQPFIVTEYKLGSGVNYTPSTSQTALQGTEVYSGIPSQPVEISANLVRYSALQDLSVGDFQFGEFGLFVGATMVAIGVSDTLISKVKTTTGLDGNFLRLDAYLDMVGTNYTMWLNFGDSANPFAMPSVQNVDQLPPTHQSVPNAYVVNSVSNNQEAFFAYSDRTGLWVFDAYKYSTTIGNRYTIVSATSVSVTITGASLAPDLTPTIFGDRIVQFASGQVYSICRNVLTVTPDLANNQVTLGFQTPLAIVPVAGDEFLVYNRDPLATNTVQVPPATTTSLGVIQVGAGLAITTAGILSVDRTTIPDGIVYSIAGIEPDGTPVQRQGDVTLTWRDVGAIRSVNSQLPDANGNVVINTSYVLPIASATALGGVRIQAGSGLQINPANGDLSVVGFSGAVTSVNSRPGPAVIVAGLVDPSPLANATDLNTVIVGKIYYAATDAVATSLLNAPSFSSGIKSGTLEVVALYELAGTGDVIQRWTQVDGMAWRRLTGSGWGTWVNPATAGLPIATTTTVGVMSVGAGLRVTPAGAVSTNIQSVNGHNGTTDPQGNPETPNIMLSAEDVGAVPAASVGAQGGVPGPMTIDPVDPPPDPNYSDYVYGRMPQDQLPLGALYYLTTWNAATNTGTYDDDTVDPPITHTVTLLAGGMMQDDWDDGAPQTVTVPANGKVLKVAVAGTTALDGITSWSVGDTVAAFGATWVKIGSGGDAVSGTFTLAAAANQAITVPAGYDPMTAVLLLKVQDTGTPANWYDASAVATVTYTTTAITVTNNATASRNFRYTLRK